MAQFTKSPATEIPFGAEKDAEEVSQLESFMAFVETDALSILLTAVVAIFLAYQFGRYFLSQVPSSRSSDAVGDGRGE